MKTVVIERDVYGEGQHRFHAGFLDFATHSGFRIKLCQPYRAQTKGKVERFNGYLRRSFYVPLASRLDQSGLQLGVVTANVEVTRWLYEVANERCMARRRRSLPNGWKRKWLTCRHWQSHGEATSLPRGRRRRHQSHPHRVRRS
jgi:transposase